MLKIKRIIMVLLVAALAITVSVSSVSATSTWTPGYWKNHSEEWANVNPLTLANEPISAADALALLKTPVRGDANLNLAQKVIAAELSNWKHPGQWNNPDNFGGHPTLYDLVFQANDWLQDNPGTCLPGSTPWRAYVIDLAGQIDFWLNLYDVG